jgi:hypothetical protein
MTEQEIRSLVRDAIARHMGATTTSVHGAFAHDAPVHRAPLHDFSHGLFVLTESEGPCIIEPSVTCNHCGYCKSYGH